MMRRRNMVGGLLAAVVAVAGLQTTALAGKLDEFKLTRAIPADAFLVVHARGHDGQAFLKKQWARVWKAVEEAHFERDIKKMITAMNAAQDEGAAEEFENQWRQVNDLLAGVDWSTLWEREFAFAMKLEFPMPQFVMLMVPPTDKVKADFDGLSAFLKTIAGFGGDDLTFNEDNQGDTTIHTLGFANAPFPVGLMLARHQDTLLVGFGTTMPEQVLAMLQGQTGTTLASTPRFQQAFGKLPTPTDSLTFFDAAKLNSQLGIVIGQAMEMNMPPAGPDGAPDESQEQMKGLVSKILAAVNLFDYVASVDSTDGLKTVSHCVTVLSDDAESSPLYAGFFGKAPIENPLRYIPKEASDVSVFNGVDLGALYKGVIGFVKENVPGGGEQIATFEQQQSEAGFSIENDILSWIGGGFSTFTVPGQTQYANAEWVMMLTVTDEAKAREMLARLFTFAEDALAEQPGGVSDAQITGAEGFKSIVHPMLGMIGITRPTLGVVDGYVMFGSSPKIIEQSLAVAAGNAPSFAKSERFLKEGVPPTGNVISIAFSDTSKTGEQIGQALQMAPMAAMMPPMSGFFAQPGAGQILRIISKLGPIVRKLDFLLSSASVTSRQGNTLVTKSVTNYRQPPAAVPAPSGGDDQ